MNSANFVAQARRGNFSGSAGVLARIAGWNTERPRTAALPEAASRRNCRAAQASRLWQRSSDSNGSSSRADALVGRVGTTGEGRPGRRPHFMRLPWLLVLLGLSLASSAAIAQDAPADDHSLPEGVYLSSVADPKKVLQVRVVRDLEMGTEIDRVSSVSSRLLERREKTLPDSAWVVDGKTTVTPTLILVRDALRPTDRRLGARLDYDAKGLPANSPDAHAGHILDLDELRHLADCLRLLTRAITDSVPAGGETIAFQFRSRSGFTVSLVLTPGQDGVTVAATVGKASANTKEAARKLFEDSGTMVQKVLQQLQAL